MRPSHSTNGRLTLTGIGIDAEPLLNDFQARLVMCIVVYDYTH